MVPAARSIASSGTVVRKERAGYLEHGVLDDERGMHYVKIVALKVVELAKMVKLASMSGAIPATHCNISAGARIGESLWQDVEKTLVNKSPQIRRFLLYSCTNLTTYAGEIYARNR